MANNVVAEIRNLETEHTFVEARFHETYVLNKRAHEASISLYTECQEFDGDNIFRGDSGDADITLDISTSKKHNKNFIAALKDVLPLDWCYMSEQVSLGFDKPGAIDVSARFDFDDLLEALDLLQNKQAAQ